MGLIFSSPDSFPLLDMESYIILNHFIFVIKNQANVFYATKPILESHFVVLFYVKINIMHGIVFGFFSRLIQQETERPKHVIFIRPHI